MTNRIQGSISPRRLEEAITELRYEASRGEGNDFWYGNARGIIVGFYLAGLIDDITFMSLMNEQRFLRFNYSKRHAAK